MSRGGERDHDRRLGQVLVAGSCILALALLAISLPGVGGTLGGAQTSPTDQLPPTTTDWKANASLVGGGPLGAGTVSPVGEEVGAEEAASPFRNRSNETLFEVETAVPGYWRVDAYDRYETEWKRTGEQIAYRGGIPAKGPVTARIPQNVTLDRAAAALPLTFQPARVEGIPPDNVTISPETGLHPTAPVEEGRNYTAASYRYRPTPESLREAGQSYPMVIEERYTQLPDDLAPRVETFATSVTSEAETPYGTAAAIAHELAETKSYTLDARHAAGADPVEQFLFEMDGGDATYFASSMVVLLRTQDIPARYVTGYSVGEPVPATTDTYRVRKVNAHAWVEVYFPGHGWVAFDPTPVEERLAVEDAAVGREEAMAHVPLATQNATELGLSPDRIIEVELVSEETEVLESETDSETDSNGEPDSPNETDSTNETDSPNETDTPSNNESETGNGSDVPPDTQPPDDQVEETENPLNVTLSTDTPEPGKSVIVTVTRGGQPVSEATVRFNGESIGTTNSEGQVRGTVPYVKTLRIGVIPPFEGEPARNGLIGGGGEIPSDRHYAGGGHLAAKDRDESADGASSGRAISVPEASSRVLAIASGSAGSDPVPGTVATQVAQTGNGNNTAQEANATVFTMPVLARVSVSVAPEPMVTGGEGTVQMLINGRPIQHAEVRVADERIGTTAETGQLAFTPPGPTGQSAIPITVSRGEFEQERTVTVGELALVASDIEDPLLPGQAVDLRAMVGSAPISGAEVRQDGEVIGRTDAEGRLTATLPLAVSTDFEVRYGGRQVTYTIGGMAQTVAIFGGVAALGLLGVVLGIRRYQSRIRDLGRRGSWLDRLVSGGTAMLLGGGIWLIERVVDLQHAMMAVWVGGIDAITSPRATLAGLWARRPGTFRQTALALFGMLAGLFSRTVGSRVGGAEDGRDSSVRHDSAAGESRLLSVREAWSSFLRLVFNRLDTSRTPTELAQDAVKAGLPSGPVERLTESFRAVEYGATDPERYQETANTALTEIESANSKAEQADADREKARTDDRFEEAEE